uniref:Secreted protein n=1 Tax=Bursaphelenchus xylophilus TaxID=6326 RepID=A0A1I7RVK6_BURXY
MKFLLFFLCLSAVLTGSVWGESNYDWCYSVMSNAAIAINPNWQFPNIAEQNAARRDKMDQYFNIVNVRQTQVPDYVNFQGRAIDSSRCYSRMKTCFRLLIGNPRAMGLPTRCCVDCSKIYP